MSDNIHKHTVWKSILFFVPCLLLFLITRLLVVFILLLPGINIILDFFSSIREESSLLTASIFSVLISFMLNIFVQEKMIKDYDTQKLTRKILGVVIFILHVVFLISNVTHDSPISPNIVCAIAGCVFFFYK